MAAPIGRGSGSSVARPDARDAKSSGEGSALLRDVLSREPAAWMDRLRRMAVALCKHSALADDLAQEVFLRAWSHEPIELNADAAAFLSAMVRHEFQKVQRGRPFSAGRSEAAFSSSRCGLDDVEVLRLAVAPSQHVALDLSSTLRALAAMSPAAGDAVLMAAIHGSASDAAKVMGRERSGFIRDVNDARRALAIACGRGGAARSFRGVRKHHRRWTAYIGVGGQQTYLGIYDSPEEAAGAYDVAAWARLGDRAKLNFPEMIREALAA